MKTEHGFESSEEGKEVVIEGVTYRYAIPPKIDDDFGLN
jgi:hypothetical protein